MKKMILIRGCQGSGKSTLARLFAHYNPRSRHYEADRWFMDVERRYDFDKDCLPDAHKWCLEAAKRALHNDRVDLVVVSNCFAKVEQLRPYLTEASLAGARSAVYVCCGDYPNVHDVPKNVVADTRNEMEPFVGERICGSSNADIDRLVEMYPKYRGIVVGLENVDKVERIPVIRGIKEESK